MRLSPRIIQAMEILQLPVLALQERIDAELQSNPVLEMHEPGVDDEAPPAPTEQADERGEHQMVIDEDNHNTEDFARLADFDDEYAPWLARSDTPARPAPAAGERDPKIDALANTAAPGESLNEYLHEQWAFVETDEPVKRAGTLIIDNMDADGYLRTPLTELVGRTNKPLITEQLAAALKLVQSLEPIGVGARDLRECLLIQLDAEAGAGIDVTLEKELVTDFLRDIELNRLPQIAKRTGKTLEQIKQAIANLSRLNPRPGSLIGQVDVPVIHPDVIVDIGPGGEPVVLMADGNTPRLYVSKAYRKMARDRSTDRSAKTFIRDNLRSAQWLMSAIEQRRQTVHRVVEEVFKVQRDFLDDGPEALKPLPMADIAGKVGVHVATVSRAVAGKYVQTPRGIFPLRMFFTSGTKTASGKDVAWDAVKAKLKEVIDAEDKSKPLNDDELAAALARHGITIARRTVAKYRKLMDIAPARQRRQY